MISRFTITLITFCNLLIWISDARAQVAVGHENPQESSILDVNATDKGMLIPRVALTALNNQSPIDGAMISSLLVYNTNAQLGAGFYYWDDNRHQWIELLSSTSASISEFSNKTWYKKESNSTPKSVNDTIWTNGQLGINTNNPLGTLHIYEPVGTAPTATKGSIVLEHGDDRGQSSIVFRSKLDRATDYAYLSYEDDGSVNGSTSENGLFTLGILNDDFNNNANNQDDINIAASGSVGISNKKPNGNASLDLGQNNKGLLINRMALSARNTQTPFKEGSIPKGLLVFNTAASGTGEYAVKPGFYYWYDGLWNLLQTQNEEKNIFNSDGVLTGDRNITLGNHQLTLIDSSRRKFHIQPPKEPNNFDSPFTFFTANAIDFQIDNINSLRLLPDSRMQLGAYGNGTIKGTPAYNLSVDASGNVIETPATNSGVQYISYNLPTLTAMPDLDRIQRNEVLDNSGRYAGLLSSASGALSAAKPSQNDFYVIKFGGYYNVKNTGTFNFSTTSDDGARIYVDDALVVEAWTTGANTVGSGSIKLAKGKHYFEFWYVEFDRSNSFTYSWGANPDGKSGTINASDFTID